MATIIEMPKLSDTMTEGTLVRWLKNPGDEIEVGMEIAEIETDKATMSMEAFDDGILHEIYVQAGEKAPLGGKLALLLEDGEEPPALGKEISSGSIPATAMEEEASTKSAAATSAVGSLPGPVSGGARVKASPLARKIAAERGVNLTQIQGTGPGGRIVKRDVENAPVAGASVVTAPSSAVAAIRPTIGANDERIPLTGMRTIIAERLLASKTQIPHFYLNIDVNAAPLLAFRQQINQASEKSDNANKYTINDFILKAVVQSAVAVPDVNASFDVDAIIRFASVNVSVAVAVDEGLVTPVIRDAQDKSLLEISRSVKDLAARARAKKLAPDEFAGGTLTVSNLGAYGIDSFDAIINPPQAFIIAISSIRKTPVVDANDQIVIGQRMAIGMSCDHRVIDGAVGAQYLAEFRRLIENPALMLL
ncbi:2-oxo acid dehydrogenase subunit E2 [bacterium]|jgi:pyruvate dehydrogenase E2 component (dihydrolipoamide acetyltransferase)|nr:2-oxo acid dehydrogenase subunit E2 [bacterium]MDF1786946.1 dihydrolipoamide acetyltransferase family protein [Verrucomicrobiales bacterium]